MAVDPAGNVYVTDDGDNNVYQVPPGASTPTSISAWPSPAGLAVDGVGNLYVADFDSGVVELAAGTFAQTTLIGGDGVPIAPDAVAIDGGGDVYAADYLGGSEHILVRSDTPTLIFPTATLVGTADTTDGTLIAQIQNIGNMPLTLTALSSYPPDFPMAAGDLNACTSSSVVPASGECDLPFTFAPLTPGSLSESVTLADNTLNVAGTQQSIGVNGTAIPFVGIDKAFGTPSIISGATTSLTITLTNNSTGTQTGIGFSDPFPTGMTVANPSGLVSTCTGTASAIAGGTTLSLSGASLSASASCTVVVNVTSVTPGLATNTTSTVGSTPGGTGLTASATLDVVALGVTLNATNVGAATAAQTVTVYIGTAGTPSTIGVLTQGAANLDFTASSGAPAPRAPPTRWGRPAP